MYIPNLLPSIMHPTEKEKKMSFFEQIKADMESHQSNQSWNARMFSTCFFLFITMSTPWIFIYDIIPYEFSDYSNYTQYWLKILTVFIATQAIANYFCVRSYSSLLYGTQDRHSSSMLPWEIDRPNDVTKHPGYCKICNLVAPEGSKTHHCKICKRCTLRRDHHCSMVGVCIGYYNQRYFVIMTFYIGMGSLISLFFFYRHLMRLSELRDYVHWSDYIPPFNIIAFFQERIGFFESLMILDMYIFSCMAILGLGFYLCQIMIIAAGMTYNDFKKGKPKKAKTSVSQNFREVFGPCWLTNFIIPMQLIFKQVEFEKPMILPDRLALSNPDIHDLV